MKLLRVALPVPVFREFDYLAPDAGAECLGRCVRVKLGPRRMLGVVVALPEDSPVPRETLLAIEGYADDLPPVPPDVLALARFAADYYQYPLGLALQHAGPAARAPGRSAARGAAIRLSTDRGGNRRHPPSPCARPPAGGTRGSAAGEAGCARRAELLLRAPAASALLRRWLAAGWIELAAAEPDPEREATVMLPELSAAQDAAVQSVVAAADSFQPLCCTGSRRAARPRCT